MIAQRRGHAAIVELLLALPIGSLTHRFRPIAKSVG
jgi:hypothetical protein